MPNRRAGSSGSSNDGERVVLRGPRKPEWCCSCGCDRNWASRTKCKECGKWAPRSILDKARKADKEAAEGGGSNGNAAAQLRNENAKLKRELAAARASDASGDGAGSGDDAESVDVDKQEATYVQALKSMRESGLGESSIAVQIQTQLDEMRAKKRASKPVLAQHHSALGKLQRLRKDEEKAKERIVEIDKRMAELEAEKVEAQKKLAECSVEIAAQASVVQGLAAKLTTAPDALQPKEWAQSFVGEVSGAMAANPEWVQKLQELHSAYAGLMLLKATDENAPRGGAPVTSSPGPENDADMEVDDSLLDGLAAALGDGAAQLFASEDMRRKAADYLNIAAKKRRTEGGHVPVAAQASG